MSTKTLPWEVKQKCTDCGIEYTAVHYDMLGVREVDSSHGRCKKHQEEFALKAFQEEEAIRLSEVARVRKEWRDKSGIPLKFMTQEFATFDKKVGGNIAKILKVCVDYAEGYPITYREHILSTKQSYRSLVLFSTLDMVGIGKTHLVCSIGHRILNRWNGEGLSILEVSQTDCRPIKWRCSLRNPVQFVSEYELYRNIQGTYNYTLEEKQHMDSETDIINSLVGRDLLILDDIGKEPRKDMDFVQRILFAIIDGRYKSLRPIVLTTNKTPEELNIYLGDASFDRLYEMTGGVFQKMTGKSYRRN
jgi:DNA replication protein DnaC